jgi:hypothetical protein
LAALHLAHLSASMVKQSAFVFIKPHAVTEAVKTLVSTDLKAKGFSIESEGRISAEQIDEGKLVRNKREPQLPVDHHC